MDILEITEKLKNRQPFILGNEKMLKFAILIPLVKVHNETHILFEVRSRNLRRQPGEVCFPGGKIEENDQNPSKTAIRETAEELGIIKSNIENVIPLDYLLNTSGNIIYPFFGQIKDIDSIQINKEEVEEIFTVPLSFFKQFEPKVFKLHLQALPEKEFPFHLIIGGENYNWQIPHIDEYFYDYNGKIIWGLTAKVLNHFIELL